MHNILANAAPLGLEFMDDAWLIVAIVIIIIGLVILGYFYDKDEGPLVLLKALVVVAIALIWPMVLGMAAAFGVIAIPIYFGFKMRKWREKQIETKKKKLASMSNVDKLKTEKL